MIAEIKEVTFAKCHCNHKYYQLLLCPSLTQEQKEDAFDVFKKFVKTAKYCKEQDTYFAGLRGRKKAEAAVKRINFLA